MPGVKVLLKGANKVVEFPSGMTPDEIQRAISKVAGAGVLGASALVSEDAEAGVMSKGAKRAYGITIDELREEAAKAGFDSIDQYMGAQLAELSREHGVDYFGIRAMTPGPKGKDIPLDIGSRVDSSFQTLDDIDPEELPGASSIGLKYDYLGEELEGFEDSFTAAQKYAHDDAPLVIIGGDSSQGGNDLRELIIGNPVIVKHLDKLQGIGGASASLGLAGIQSENASAQGRATASLATSITNPLLSMEQLAKLPGHLRPDVGSIQGPIKGDSDVVAAIQDLGGLLSKFEVPVLGNPVQGLADYMQNFGYNDSEKERLKRAALAVLDFL